MFRKIYKKLFNKEAEPAPINNSSMEYLFIGYENFFLALIRVNNMYPCTYFEIYLSPRRLSRNRRFFIKDSFDDALDNKMCGIVEQYGIKAYISRYENKPNILQYIVNDNTVYKKEFNN